MLHGAIQKIKVARFFMDHGACAVSQNTCIKHFVISLSSIYKFS